MESHRTAPRSRPHLFGLLAGLFLAGGLCLSAFTLARAWIRISESQSIVVTGSARRNVRSDLVIWRASFSTEAATLLGAQEALERDRATVTAWLAQQGISESEMKPVQVSSLTARDESDSGVVMRRVGYRLSQAVEVRSGEVDRLPRLATESNALLAQGVTFASDEFQFLYTAAGEAKIEMMADAAEDARTRAERIAETGRRRIKELRSARMGVVQINPLHSNATSWDGNNDTTAIDKTIIVTVTATFSLD